MAVWSVEYEGDAFERFLFSLPAYEQAVLVAAIEHVLQAYGIDICAGEWGKLLGEGLYEFRIRKSLRTILVSAGLDAPEGAGTNRSVLLRVFCTFDGDKIVLLYHGYNKKTAHRRSVSSVRSRRRASSTSVGSGSATVDHVCVLAHNDEEREGHDGKELQRTCGSR